ncbi:MAG: class I SAM-dependent methyltransferase [Enterobacterales bacterium]|nr:class I SAM-dependent methyltransferase [Enterobacterales bacterium]
MSTTREYYGNKRPELARLVDNNAATVLDLGCGQGVMSAAIKSERNAKEIWGVEVVEDVAQIAQRNPAFHKVLSGNLEQLIDQIPDNYFSYIIAGDVLEHLVDPWSILAKLRLKLTDDGTFICSIPNIRNISFFVKLLFSGRFEYKDSGVMDRTHLRFFARKDVRLMFEEAGFSDISIGPVRPKKALIKRIGRALLGDLVIKGFLITASK